MESTYLNMEIRPYGVAREVFGKKAFMQQASPKATVADVLFDLDTECVEIFLLEEFEKETPLILKNGTYVMQLAGVATALAYGNRLSLTFQPMSEG